MAKKKGRPAKKEKKQPEKQPKAEKKPTRSSPRQAVLPGMADRKIAALENAALHYADVRDERMRWTKQEVDAKKEVQKLMHDQDRTHYERGNIEIELVPEGEHVHVRVRDREQEPVDEPLDYPPEPPVTEPREGDEPVEDPEKVYDSQEKADVPGEF